jgi:hypothetical protein
MMVPRRHSLAILLLAFLIVGLSPTAGRAQATAGAPSLLITPGARADGMGRAHAAVVYDGTAGWWNPAALGRIPDHVVSLMHTQLVPDLADDVYYEYLGYVQPLEGWGGVGASLTFLTYGKSVATDEEGRELGTFTSYEISPAVSAGTKLTESLYAGITLKFVYVNLAPKEFTLEGKPGTGNTFGADIGFLYAPENVPISLAMVLQNLGPSIAYIDEDQADPLGRNLKLGAGIWLLRSEQMGLVTTFDFNRSLIVLDGQLVDEDPIYNWGIEWSYANLIATRLGYIHDNSGDIKDFTFGFGLAYGRLSFDYASVPQAEGLARVSKFSLNYRF